MSSSDCFLTFSVIAVILTFGASFRVRRIGLAIIPYFFLSWMILELAWFHIIVQSLLAIYFIIQGTLQTTAGINALILTLVSIIGLLRLNRISHQSSTTYNTELEQHFGVDYLEKIDPVRRQHCHSIIDQRAWFKPFSMRRSGVRRLSNIRYGDHERHVLDIYLPDQLPDTPCPVLYQIHGGGWIIGTKDHQALPLMNHLAQRGWICVAINYRLSPKSRFPAHIEDVKKALVWIKNNIASYGGDPDFIVATGGSAGGHLSSLLALTADKPSLQPGFENADTQVQGCVPLYGVYDFVDGNRDCDALPISDFLNDYVMPNPPQQDPQMWKLASSISNVHADAPPMFVIHGAHDSLAIIEEARRFVTALRAVSKNPVLFAELDSAQHAFEIFHSVRTEHTLTAVTRFIEILYKQYLSEKSAPTEQDQTSELPA